VIDTSLAMEEVAARRPPRCQMPGIRRHDVARSPRSPFRRRRRRLEGCAHEAPSVARYERDCGGGAPAVEPGAVAAPIAELMVAAGLAVDVGRVEQAADRPALHPRLTQALIDGMTDGTANQTTECCTAGPQ
jgi:hypothetical protein